jgi:hypothetical protein
MENKIVVYRFTRRVHEQDVSPQLMWGTPDAISALNGCSPLDGSQREVTVESIEGGFYFEALDIPDLKIEDLER